MYDALIKRGRKRPLLPPSEANLANAPISRAQLEQILPHRDPFMLLDSVHHVDLEHRCAFARRFIDPQDPVFVGHFPGDPIYPGVLLLEIVGQLGICLQHWMAKGTTTLKENEQARQVRLLKVHHGAFFEPVGPESNIVALCQVIEDTGYLSTCAGQILIEDAVMAFAIFDVFILDD